MGRSMAVAYQALMEDEDLLSLKGDVALLHLRIHELVKRLGTGETGGLWRKLRIAYESLQSAGSRKDAGGIKAGIEEIGRIVQSGADVEGVWTELFDLVEKRTKTVGMEWKRLMEMRQLLTVEEALALVVAIMDIVKDTVTDRKILQRISEKVTLIIGEQKRVLDPADDRPKTGLPVIPPEELIEEEGPEVLPL